MTQPAYLDETQHLVDLLCDEIPELASNGERGESGVAYLFPRMEGPINRWRFLFIFRCKRAPQSEIIGEVLDGNRIRIHERHWDEWSSDIIAARDRLELKTGRRFPIMRMNRWTPIQDYP